MADKLTIFAANNFRFYLQWEVEVDGDIELGATLCEGADDGLGEEPTDDRGNWEHWIACKTVRELEGFDRDDRGAAFDSRAEAQKALAVVKLAMKQDRPMPEWAKTALAQGWKPPKGWKA